MTSDQAYPGMDDWAAVLDQWRCPTVRAGDPGYRCQLYAGHENGHAHALRLPGKTWRTLAYRWDDAGARWTEEPPSRLRRWCCMFTT